MNDAYIKNLAFKYFEGNISPQEADALFAFIQESGENLSLFRNWENEWTLNTENNPQLNQNWEAFKNKNLTRENIHTSVPTRKNFRTYFSVAGIALLLLMMGIGTFYLTQNTEPEQFYTMEVPYGQKSKITLSDGSIVWLNAGTTFKYSNKFNKKNRKVQLVGEGYFEIAKSHKEFVVQTAGYDIVVKGTKFNVTSYPEDHCSSTSLFEGSVQLRKNNAVLQLEPGDHISLDFKSNIFTRTKHSSENARMWTENHLEYENIRLEDLLRRLSREYNQKIVLSNADFKDEVFSISIRNEEKITDVLEAITKTVPLKITINNDTIKLM